MSVKALEKPENEVSASEFHSLEEKIYRTIELLKTAREAKANAERDSNRLRTQLEESEEENEQLRSQLVNLRKEREDVRTRVEKMLKQIDALTVAESEA
jgi:chromosome segregation ATPase